MMAPKYMRAAQIAAAVTTAAMELDKPIDRIEIDGTLVRAFAGEASIVIKCRLAHDTDEHGHPLLGSDRWETEPA